MRHHLAILAATFALAGCGGSDEKKAEAPAADSAATLAAGEYQLDGEITALAGSAGGAGVKLGDKSSRKVCIGADGKTSAATFMPRSSDSCTAESEFVRSGRIASSYKCNRAGSGSYGANVDGTIANGGFEADVNIASYFGNGSDYRSTERVKATRIGDCPKA